MGFKSDIEIAQECEMLPITKIAEKAGVDICVAGTSVYKAADVKKAISTLKLSQK